MSGRHTIRLGAPRDMSGGLQPAILQRSDDRFVEATLDDLGSAAGRQALEGLRAKVSRGALRLYQPVQRLFHLAVLEAWCDAPGTPRLNPAEVLGAGMVLRRVQGSRREGWMRAGGRLRGWVALDRIGGAEVDPKPDAHLQRRLTGVTGIDRQLAAHADADSRLEEAVIPLYVAPPDVCQAAGKTLFYGVIPTVSSELAETKPEFMPPGDDSFGPRAAFFRDHLAGALRGLKTDFPFPGETLAAGWFDAAEMPGDNAPAGVSAAQWVQLKNPDSADARRLRAFIQLLRQLGSEFNAFEDGKETTELVRRLKAIRLTMKLRPGETTPRQVEAWGFLKTASAILLAKESLAAPEMPESWPALSAADAMGLADALHAAMLARFAAMQGKAGRYDEPDARYVLRAFLRLKCPLGGPPRVVWSAESPAFAIAPWYESDGSVAPVQIPLPDPADRALLKSLKPNVAFVVPPALQNLLSGKAGDLLEGKGGIAGAGLAWICSFNIPIITLCAFLVLNIFLGLFNLFFGWLFAIKICLPFPKLGNKPPSAP